MYPHLNACLIVFLSIRNVGPTNYTFLVKWTEWIRTYSIKNHKKQKKPLSLGLQNKYSTTLLKIVKNKIWGSLIVSKVASWTPSDLFLWDSLKYIRWDKCTRNFLRRTYSWWKPFSGWSCLLHTFCSYKRWSWLFFPCKNNEDKQKQNLSKS